MRTLAIIASILLATSASGLSETTPPGRVVESLHSGLLTSMKDAATLGYDGRYAHLQGVLQQTFDLAFMAEKSVGRHWKKLGESEQERWLDAFGRLTTANYAGRFVGYSGQYFETLGEEPAAHETVLVRTRLVIPADDDIVLNYRLRETENGWRIIDVYLNGTVSELALRRSEYASTLKRDGFEVLCTLIDSKLAEFAQKAKD